MWFFSRRRMTARSPLIVLVAIVVGVSVGAQPPESEPKSTQAQRLDDRLRKLEEQNRALLERYEDLSKKYDQLLKKSDSQPQPKAESSSTAQSQPTKEKEPAGPTTQSPASSGSSRQSGSSWPVKVDFGARGLRFRTEDDRFTLEFHNELQLDYRAFATQGPGPVRSSFYIPRERFFFSGNVGKPLEYRIAFNRGYGTGLELLDAQLNLKLAENHKLLLGRYRIPSNYDWFQLSNLYFMSPERPLYSANFGMARQLGAAINGKFFEQRLEYAAGIFNGPRNSFEDYNNDKDFVGYVSYQPFLKSRAYPWLKNFSMGGSLAYGEQDNPLFPRTLKTLVNSTEAAGAAAASPTFFEFYRDSREVGDRGYGSLHLAYYGLGWSVIAQYDALDTHYLLRAGKSPVLVPVRGWYVEAGYFLTGEQPENRGPLKPLHPFRLAGKDRGLGALEIHARYATLELGESVFQGKLADPARSSREAATLDLGLNWHWNEYVKLIFNWQRGMYGSPVDLDNADGPLSHSDVFLMRFQLYF